jgi:predicted ArsR family transcriptional regulator
MPVDLRMIAKEAGVSKSAIKRHLKQLKNSDLVFFDGKDVLLSYSGLYTDL